MQYNKTCFVVQSLKVIVGEQMDFFDTCMKDSLTAENPDVFQSIKHFLY